MQQDYNAIHSVRPRLTRTRLVGMKENSASSCPEENGNAGNSAVDVASQTTLAMNAHAITASLLPSPFSSNGVFTPISPLPPFEPDEMEDDSKAHLMRLSGMMRAIRLPETESTRNALRITGPDKVEAVTGEWWPNGIEQTGPLPVVNLYGSEPFGRTMPRLAAIPVTEVPVKAQLRWKGILDTPVARVSLGLIIGIGLLLLVARIVNIPMTLQVLRANLATPHGITFALLSGVAFLLAYSVRGLRWKLFLNSVGNISIFKAISLFLVGIFLNFLLPISGGEVAKSLMLKRVSNIPIRQSLPTIAMDRSLDLMPALFIMVIVPVLGVQMDIKLWFVLGLVAGLLIGLILFVGLAAWKRTAAVALLQRMTTMLPKGMRGKIESFATGFVDSLLAGASQPKVFLFALLLTCVAVTCDALFALFAFWTIGFPIPFGTALFGYTVYNMFFILPTPPGQVGSNEIIGLLVFAGLLHLPADKVTAMFVFSHPWAALLMCSTGLICLHTLGLTISSAMKAPTEEEMNEKRK